jgi:predicted metalloprotease with PDZ domain
MLRDMPQGQPQPGDEGLDHTHTWARTYWGGALFCLLADVRIHEQTKNRKGLQDALRAIVAAGGTISVDWPLERALKTGDAATGVGVLTGLYNEMKAKPAPADLEDLWKRLGIERDGRTVVFHDDAPLGATRQAITAPRK